MLRIHDILGVDPDPGIHASGIRIRILDPDPAIFVNDLQDASKKLIIEHNFFCLLLFEGTFTSFSKIKGQKESKKVGIKVFLTIFA